MYNLGIVGLGEWGSTYINTLVRDFPQINLKAACRRGDIRPDFLPPSCNFYTDWRDLYRREQLDGIIVAASTPEVVCGLLDHGIPVMAEKPICLNIETWERIEPLAQRTPLLVNYIHCFTPQYSNISRTVDVNQLDFIWSVGCGRSASRDYSSLYDYGSHDVAMILGITLSYPHEIICAQLGDLFCIGMQFDNIRSVSFVGKSTKKMRTFAIGDDEVDNDPRSINYALEHFIKTINRTYRQPLSLTRDTVSILEECARQTHVSIC